LYNDVHIYQHHRRTAGKQHVDELGQGYFALKYRLKWHLVWRHEGSLARADVAVSGADTSTLVDLALETGQSTVASLEALLAKSWQAPGAEAISAQPRIFPRLCELFR